MLVPSWLADKDTLEDMRISHSLDMTQPAQSLSHNQHPDSLQITHGAMLGVPLLVPSSETQDPGPTQQHEGRPDSLAWHLGRSPQPPLAPNTLSRLLKV